MFPSRSRFVVPIVAALLLSGCAPAQEGAVPEEASWGVVVFSATAGFRHASIPAGVEAIRALGAEHGFAVTATEDATVFDDAVLAEYDAVVFLNTTGDVLDEAQQVALRRFVEAGGGFVGVHAATDTEYGWPWYGALVGARFDGHPPVQEARVEVVDPAHPSTAHLPDPWTLREEWYSFRDVQPELRVLLELDEASYDLGNAPSMEGAHPIAWTREVGAGRSWYTGLGHRSETFADPRFRTHLLGGIEWAAGRGGSE